MCEVLLCVVDHSHPTNIYLDTKLPKRGDIIDIVADGHLWGGMELSDPDWRILRLPGIDRATLSDWLVRGAPQLRSGDHDTQLYRLHMADLDHVAIPSALTVWLNDASRAVPIATVPAILLATVRISRPLVTNPAVIG